MSNKILYGFTDVQEVVDKEVILGVYGLKERVLEKVRAAMKITSGNLPKRVCTWVHNTCMEYTGGIELRKFEGKLAEPINLRSLPNSLYNGR